jgi:hypothetical protein
MSEIHPEIVSHTLDVGMFPVRLHGGPWDGKVVGVRVSRPPFVQVNGPRHGNHTVWITHLYALRGERYEFVSTEVTPLEGWAMGRQDLKGLGTDHFERLRQSGE